MYRIFSKYIRSIVADYQTYCPIKIIESSDNPKLVGSSWGWYTRGGSYIRYPSGYARKGRSNMIYSPSTKKIEVGKDWLLVMADKAEENENIKLSKVLRHFAGNERI